MTKANDCIWEIFPLQNRQAEELTEAGGITRPVALALAARNIGPEEINKFLRPQLRDLTDPYRLPGVKAASERIWQAIKNGQPIVIHGDYDTDGITASVLLAGVLRQNGASTTCFLPHRFDDGYGLTEESVSKLCGKDNPLLITVDCGITSFEALQAAKDLGVEVIVTDHHEPGDRLPPADIIINPKVADGGAGSKDFAGVGIAFKLCHGFIKYGRQHGLASRMTDLREQLDLLALGTVADIVPLLGENRCLVRYGLEVLSSQRRPGIRALCEIAELGDANIRARDVAYRLAPRLNAAGRMGDAHVSMKLLESDNVVEAYALAEYLEEQNRSRQQLEESASVQAEAQLREIYDLENTRTIVVWNREWHQGVVGIVASRLARSYNRPVIVLTSDNSGELCGSARSIRRVSLIDILDLCNAHLTRFGGHAMAAGLSLKENDLPAFRQAFDTAVSRILGAEAMRPHLQVCGVAELNEFDEIFFMELAMLEPFGHGNEEPLFLIRNVTPERILTAGTRHSRGIVTDGSGAKHNFILFDWLPEELPPAPWDIVCMPQMNNFAGKSTPQLRMLDVRSSV